MIQEKKSDQKSFISSITYIRRNVLFIRPRKFILVVLHWLAMNFPIYKARIIFYRLRGTKIGKNVSIAHQVFLEEGHPELITIKDLTDIGPRVMVITHDTILSHLDPTMPVIRTKEVIIGTNCYIGAGTIILPGVTIGDNSIIGAGAVVTKSIPPGSVAMGIPAKVVSSSKDRIRNLVNK
jgi:acetyltransferase-like isoleucine patch superfamily enzyme